MKKETVALRWRKGAVSLLAASVLAVAAVPAQAQKTSSTARQMEAQGMVRVQDELPSVHVDLMYAKADNFTGRVLYSDLCDAYLHPKAIAALRKADQWLKQNHPELALKIYDATRPMSIQQKMWDVVKGTSKKNYVSNPANGGGMHNYGLAVDITLCKAQTGDSIAMGTLVDHMSFRSHIDEEAQLVERGIISKTARQNRQILRQAMKAGGFMPLRTEWWHFNLVDRPTAKKYYKVVR